MAITGAHVARAPRIRLGMVGGGRDAFFGAVHRIAARLDDQYELVAGCFSANAEKSLASAADLGVARAYTSYADMAAKEARRKDGIEAVAIVTPIHMHAPVTMQYLKRGIHVICDKPLTATLAEAKPLAKAAEASGVVFALTHNDTGYPMIRQAKAMIAAGELGRDPAGAGGIRAGLAGRTLGAVGPEAGRLAHRSGAFRRVPARSGAGGSTGDIGTHAFNLAGFVTGLEVDVLAADLQAFVSGRRVDDNGHVLMRYKGGHGGCCGADRWRQARETGCGCGSMAPRPGSSGRRRTPTTCGWAP